MQDTLSQLEAIKNEPINVLPTMSVRFREAFPDPGGMAYRVGRRLAGTAPGQTPYRALTKEEMDRILLRRTLLSPGRAAAAYED